MSSEESASTTLLVVDDEPQLLRLMTRVLERGSFRVLSAADANEAMAILEAHHDEIRLVVLDVILPPRGIDELLDRLVTRHDGVPVVLTSGDTIDDAIRTQVEARGGVFLRKPFSPKLLLKIVQDLLAAVRGAASGVAEGA
ncbi:MAG: response regulator [Deltaproteobacteria bacterium]|nr:response regulator [Deltaproteobacteria bacterium]MBW2418927.1 response regulator [Deltaproteobacteria bacterium]